jgi:hypothetical protein
MVTHTRFVPGVPYLLHVRGLMKTNASRVLANSSFPDTQLLA